MEEVIFINKLCFNDELYPSSLRNIPNPPQNLYFEGNINLLSSNIIAIIGSRKCSKNGISLANKFSYELSNLGITIISGLAIGIDSAAHNSSYNQKGSTIAVLPSGFNNIFPKENIQLVEKILNNNGLIVSEYPPEETYKQSYFLERNRIISGLSLGILVVEAAFRSGTSVTAKIAKTQGKKVFALPHEISDIHGVGTNKLIKNGAILTTSIIDILDELNLHKLKSNCLFNNFKTFELNLQNSNIHKNKKILNNSKLNSVYKFINFEPISINELSKKANKPINEIMNGLFLLEIDDYVQKVPGGYVCIPKDF